VIKIEVLIPLTDNLGASFSQEHFRTFESLLLSLFGGYSLLPGHVVGGWRDEVTGSVYHDQLVTYVVALPSITKADVLSEVGAFAKSHFQQQAIFISYLGVAEIL
jgi:hypothetical protein